MWSLSKVHQLGELCAAVAVVLSLLFVGYEVQQNNRRQLQATTQSIITEYAVRVAALSEDLELACIYAHGIEDYTGLSGADRLRFSAWWVSLFRVIEDMYFQMEEGSIDPRIWSGIESTFRETMQLPGTQQWFAQRRDWFSQEFQGYIQSMMEEPAAVSPVTFNDPQCRTRDFSN